MKASLRALLESAVDYAGTFPPARLDLARALRAYAEYRAGPHAWMLGRFLLAAPKLEEFEELAPRVVASAGGGAWPLSLILAAGPGPEIERAESFARRWEGAVRVASVEVGPLEASRIGAAAARVPAGLESFFEVPLGPDLEPRLAAVAAAGAAAKARTGGLSEEAFPGTGELSRFLLACARAGLPWKATAGLHHPFRGARSLDRPGSRRVAMHGFLNLAVAAALVHAGKVGPEEAQAVLEESSPEAFHFEEDGLAWRGRRLEPAEIVEARRRCFRSFGACSFEEPVADLEDAGLL